MRAFLALAFLALPLAASAAEPRFEKRTVTVNGVAYPYQVFVPESFGPASKPPVLLALHGAGERGSEGEHTRVGLGRALRKDPSRWPFLVVFPQCPKDSQWIGDPETVAFFALEEALVEFHGDRERVSLLGMSMGGAGTWWGAFQRPGVFAAVVPICGYIVSSRGFPIQSFRPPDMHRILESGDPYGVIARGLGKTPVWAFHGDADDTIPVTESRRMAEALRLAGGNAAYTEFPGINHNAWDPAFAEPDLVPWLLAQKRGAPGRRPKPSTTSVLYTGATVYRAWDASPAKAAILVEGGGVRFLGGEREARALAPEARVVDLAGAVVVPGLTDAHGHLRGLGALRRALDLRGLSKEETLARVKSRAARAAEGEWIHGRGWDQNRWPKKTFPTAAELSAASPGHPVVLGRVDGHAIWVNEAALVAAHVTAKTKDPDGGRIERLVDGRPAGVLVDNATALVWNAIPESTPEELERDYLAALEACARVGLTGVGDASGSNAEEIGALSSLAREKKMPIRVYATVGPRNLDEAIAKGPLQSGRLTIRALKIVADGALGSRGAALLADYSDAPGNRGLDVTPPEETERLAEKALRGGFQVWTHAIGDRANRVTLDAYEKALAAVRPIDPRPRIEHAQILAPLDAERFAKLGVIASVQPTHATSDMPWAETRVGPERIKGAYTWRVLLKSGAHLAGGSDFAVESENPLLGIYAAVTRQDLSGYPPGGWRREEALTRAEALRLFTADNAYAEFAEERRGRIAPTYDADFTVLDRDIVSEKTPDAEIPKAKVRMTVVGGEIVYRASPP
jgi:predicted amidohydrolase YtcJ/pimeloyl-ACP methyl ester carboxylesterase